MPPMYECPHVLFSDEQQLIDHIQWEHCPSVQLVDTVTGLAPKEQTEVKACWSSEALYIRFECTDHYVKSDYTKRDDPLYEQDVIEVFIDLAGDGKQYIELEVSPHNVVFDAKITGAQGKSHIVVDTAWDIEGLYTAVKPFEHSQQPGNIYLLKLPTAALGKTARAGDAWRINFYRIDQDESGQRQFQAWSPTGEVNYHKPNLFGTLLFR
ncbi:hypothetical protein J40TS1_39480 [Paenibacillus montaniterrae]|uniref:Carbohydrate-binding domain-containing protein n=2 Tax=Paenibacillus montaniterrae TaxID=429341 RepID=A0A920CYX1_9BACL|nr:hypothetical protein J40TS1_39480 [Paenibacillus montaniterrae]